MTNLWRLRKDPPPDRDTLDLRWRSMLKTKQWDMGNLRNGGGRRTHAERKSENAPTKGDKICGIQHRQRGGEIQEAPGRRKRGRLGKRRARRISVKNDYITSPHSSRQSVKRITEQAPPEPHVSQETKRLQNQCRPNRWSVGGILQNQRRSAIRSVGERLQKRRRTIRRRGEMR